MSEHIKTAIELSAVLLFDGESENEKWVSLSWLRKEIQIHLCKGVPDSPGENIQNNTLKWVLSLLEDS
jgi:hypothetical protein